MNYILNPDHSFTPCEDILEWAKWFTTNPRHVAEDFIGESRISTVFLGIDHAWNNVGGPILFETMVFGGPLDGEMKRYHTWDKAREGHERILQEVRRKFEESSRTS